MQIRAAGHDDWAAIRPFFHEIVEAGETYAIEAGLSSDEEREQWFLPGFEVFVAVDDDDGAPGSVLGTAKFGPNRPGRGGHVATASFMVDPRASGRGIGRALGEFVVEAARAAGYRSMQFNAVVETNVRAVALWHSLGFETLTVVPEAFEHPTAGFVGLTIMHRRL